MVLGAILRSLGSEVRQVFNMMQTGHMWLEIWSQDRRKWIVIEAQQKVINQALEIDHGENYDGELNNPLYFITINHEEARDVTPRYVYDIYEIDAMGHPKIKKFKLNYIEKMNKHLQDQNELSAERHQYLQERADEDDDKEYRAHYQRDIVPIAYQAAKKATERTKRINKQ
jgi:hypothetical protein